MSNDNLFFGYLTYSHVTYWRLVGQMKSQSDQQRKIIPSKFLKIIVIFILIRSQIILSLAVINICPTANFIAHATTLLLQHSVSLSPSLSLFLSLCCLAYSPPFSVSHKKVLCFKYIIIEYTNSAKCCSHLFR